VLGDAIYDGALIDTLPESDVAQYLRTMDALRTLEVEVVYPGHGEPFGGERLRELAEQYLRARRLTQPPAANLSPAAPPRRR